MTPEQFPEAFRQAWMARDGDAIGALFAEDADFVNVVGIWWEDRAGIASAHSKALRTFFADTRLVLGRVKVRHLGEVAIVHARVLIMGQRTPGGGVAGKRNTILTFVLERRGEGWIAVSAQNTDIVPGSETMIAGARYR